ncbi:MAG TPA: ATP-binding protein [Opitutaceae bacterium]|nr:ATP-binding protein [Opitutaceae bacterium]
MITETAVTPTDCPLSAKDIVAPLPCPAGDLSERTLLENLLATVPDHVYFKDLNSRFLAVSESLASRGGKRSSDLVGKSDFDLFTDAHARPAFEDEQQIIRTGEPITNKLEKEQWPDGRTTYVLSSKLPLRSETGEIVGTFGISKDVTASKATEAALEKTRTELVDASRLAGMAEVATGVLHNVGNVLVSINIATDSLASAVRSSKVGSIGTVAALLKEHAADLGDYLTVDPKGRLLPEFIGKLATHLVEDQAKMLAEIESLRSHVAHVKDIVTMQQDWARLTGLSEPLDPVGLVEDALRMNTAALARHEVTLVREFQTTTPVVAERGKVLQILVNLIRNAKYACDEGKSGRKDIIVRIAEGAPGRIRFEVIDTGIGILAENINRIFVHGFTTKADGHGFGLHSSANAARELNGSLKADSDGLNKGARFILDLPAADSPPASGSSA